MATFVDVESPVQNVYAMYMPAKLPAPGDVFHFGVPADSPMQGAWTILSIERPWINGVPNEGSMRVNVIRKERLK